VKPGERLSRNQFVISLKPSQVRALAELAFVDTVRLYSEADTLRLPLTLLPDPVMPGLKIAPKQAAKKAASAEAAKLKAAKKAAARPAAPVRTKSSHSPRVYNVRLHLAKDRQKIVNWLKRHNRTPLWSEGDCIQVALFEGSRVLIELAKRKEVASVDPVGIARLFDTPARALLRIAVEDKTIGLTGDGEIVGVADTGIDKDHPDFVGRIAGVSAWGRPGDTSDPEGHGTHVCGCVAGDGSGSDGEVMGAAPEAKLFVQSILDSAGNLGGLPKNIGDLLKEAYDNGVRIHNNSWGAFTFASYTSTSQNIDEFVLQNQDMLVVIAAGNDGIGIPRAAGSKMLAADGFVDWPCVAAPATAKNGLTVGASRNDRKKYGYSELTWRDAWSDRYPLDPIAKEKISGDAECLAAFSSRGPCDDMRIKPDVVAPGTDIAAARSKDAPLHKYWGAYPNNTKYGFMGGTSMAAPYVAGCAALVRQWYRTKGKWDTPSAALLKATLINGTRRITGKDASAPVIGDPNYHQGFGRIDMVNTVPNDLEPKLKLEFVDAWQKAGDLFTTANQSFRYQIKVGDQLPLRICLAWTDRVGRAVQNSLVLLVDDSGSTKWRSNATAATVLPIAGLQRDPQNNVQVVRIEKPKPGLYTIAVFASMVTGTQSYSVVVTGDLQSSLKPYNG
jgi:subtilisin family serine protease